MMKAFKVFIWFFGGEPLIGYENPVKPIIDYAVSICDKLEKHLSISFTSNAGLINQRITNHISGLKVKPHFQVTLDGSRDYHNKVRFWKNGKGSYDTILENVQKLLEVGSEILLRVNFTKENYKSCDEILIDILGLNLNKYDSLSLIFRQVWQDIDQDPQTDEEMAETVNKFREEGFRVEAPLDLSHRSFSCYEDRTNQALVNYNGDVFKCTARDFETGKRLGFLNESGEIVWEAETLQARVCRKYTKQICQKCRIFPLCGGGCSQKAIEGSDMSVQ